MASTVLPNGIIIPEKYSRDWYNDLYHNWQELDNLLGDGTPKDGTLTIQKNGTTVGTFSANQATNETVNIEVPTKTSDLTNDSNFVQSSDLATVATSGSYNDLSNKPTIPSKTSELTNDSGFITEDNTKIPLAGSNQISGDLIPATTNTYNLGDASHYFNYGYFQNLGKIDNNVKVVYNYTRAMNISRYDTPTSNLYAQYILYKDKDGGNLAYFQYGYETNLNSRFQLKVTSLVSGNTDLVINYRVYGNGRKSIEPQSSGDVDLGSGSYLFGQIYSTNATISTSDERQKDNIKQIDDKLLDAWEDVDLVQFNFKDALEKKGDNARLHTGYIAQNIQQACKKNGVNPNDYGLFCYDSWEEQEEKKDENGQVIEPYRAKGDLYSLRYEEALVVECKYLRRCIARLTARIEELEKGNNTK